MKYSGIGGQAVIEGIMMMKGEDYAVAVRRPDKEIEVKKDTYQSITKKAKILQLPFVRGVFRFADSMIIGMRRLSYSIYVPRGGAQVHQLCGTRTSADGKICARELEGAQALWYQFYIDCHGDQYSDVYGDPGRYDLDADFEPYYSGSGHCGYII